MCYCDRTLSGQIIAPGAEFVKSWRMTNDGSTSWPEGTALVFIAGNRLAAFKDAPTRYKVGGVAPGSAVDVWAGDMKVSELYL
jgi:next-to-BRCA1 protein 1